MATKQRNLRVQEKWVQEYDLHRALCVAAAVVERYAETPFENDAIGLFERLEAEIQSALRRSDIRARARLVLVGNRPII